MLKHHQPGMMYVEGLAMLDIGGGRIIPIHHAWIEWDGKLIDPTLDSKECEGKEYRVGVRLDQAETCRMFADNKHPAWSQFKPM